MTVSNLISSLSFGLSQTMISPITKMEKDKNLLRFSISSKVCYITFTMAYDNYILHFIHNSMTNTFTTCKSGLMKLMIQVNEYDILYIIQLV